MGKTVSMTSPEEGIVIITLNRPKAANALSFQMLMELQEVIENCKNDQSIRCLILTGEGEKAFCAGADLKERAGMELAAVRRAVSTIRHTINQVEKLPQPVIAAINGSAFGGGMELAIACDIRVASETAQLGLTETSLGIIPGAGGTQRLPRLIGKGKAKELIYTARRINAKEAKELGLVEFIEPPETVIAKGLEIAKQIARNGPIAVKQAKFAIDNGLNVDLNTGLEIEKNAYEITIPTKDRMEGLKAFKEKRIPIYKGE